MPYPHFVVIIKPQMPVPKQLYKLEVLWSDFEFDLPFVFSRTPYTLLGSQGPKSVSITRCRDYLARFTVPHSQQDLTRSHTAVLEEPAYDRVVSLHMADHDVSSLYVIVPPSLLTPSTADLEVTAMFIGTKVGKEREEALETYQ